MAIIEVTKEFIVDAIRNEPDKTLQGGSWVQVTDDYYELCNLSVDSPECAVCAVGAVMRRALDSNQNARAIHRAAVASTDRDRDVCGFGTIRAPQAAREMCDRGSYMNALSVLFEAFDDECDRDAVKQVVIDFVMNEFPPTIRIDIDGAKPAADVKVVEPGRRWVCRIGGCRRRARGKQTRACGVSQWRVKPELRWRGVSSTPRIRTRCRVGGSRRRTIGRCE